MRSPIYTFSDSKNAIQISALAMLFAPVTRIRCKKLHWKPSITECQESIINLVSVGSLVSFLILQINFCGQKKFQVKLPRNQLLIVK